jgi:hypothetical protein
MKKIAYYLGKTVFKIIGLFWWWIAVWFRAYSRNVVHNYYMQNDLYMKRLRERKHEWFEGSETFPKGWLIEAGHGTEGGYIEYREVSKWQFYLVFWLLWIWVDDDAFCDTNGEFYARRFGVLDKYTCEGNYFDVGDMLSPSFHLVYSYLWNVRNTAYNYNYAFQHIYEG